MQAEEVIKRVIELCGKYAADQGILFGSRAKGTALESFSPIRIRFRRPEIGI